MAIEKSALAAAISDHWEAMKRQKVDVPEWNTTIWFDPLTLAERDEFANLPGNEFTAEIIIKKATDENGKRLFTKADKAQLLDAAAPSVVARIASRILVADTIQVDKLGKP